MFFMFKSPHSTPPVICTFLDYRLLPRRSQLFVKRTVLIIMPSRVFNMAKSLDESLAELDAVPTGHQKVEDSPRQKGHASQPSGITYAHQSYLQKLPIPELQDTCRRYLDAVRPLQTPREHEETIAAVKEFMKTDGPELQERLLRYAASKASYIERFCKLNAA